MFARPSLLAILYLGFPLCALVSQTLAQDDKACPTPTGPGAHSTCTCQTDDGSIIDLSPLAKTDGTAKFTSLKDVYGYNYDYNPCTPFSEGESMAYPCQNVFMCQTLPAKHLVYTVANSNEQIFKESSSGKYYVHYDGPADRETKVYLNCDQCSHDGKIISVEQLDDDYVLQLYSCHACPGGCSYDTSGCSVQPDIL